MVPSVFLFLSAIGLVYTANALQPVRRPGGIALMSFFSSALTTEFAPHILVWQVVGTGVFVALGALDSWLGLLGLGLMAISWAGLAIVIGRSLATGGTMNAALERGLGEEYLSRVDPLLPGAQSRRFPWRAIASPLPIASAGTERVRDIVYHQGSGKPLRLDLYRPADRRPGCPVLLYLHGGAWVMGDKREQGRPLLVHLAANGWVCVTANYRLSPGATWPDQLIDVKQALRWIKEHGAEFGADPNWVVIAGASAGGHLASLAALTANDHTYQPGFETVDTAVAACVSFYGVYDLTNRIGRRRPGFTRLMERKVIKRRLSDAPEVFASASPMDQIGEDCPPFMVIHGSNDVLVPLAEARHFAALLRQHSRRPVVYAELLGAQHAFDALPSIRTVAVLTGVQRFCDALYTPYLQAHPGLRAGRDARSPTVGPPVISRPDGARRTGTPQR